MARPRRSLVVVSVLGAVTALLRKRASNRRAEKDLWNEATVSPAADLR